MDYRGAKGEHAYLINLTEENFINEGTYGKVYKIYSQDEKKVYAGKFLKKELQNLESVEKLGNERELEILQKSNHPFIIKYYEKFNY